MCKNVRREDAISPGAGVTGSSELPDVGARVFLAISLCPDPLTCQEQSMWILQSGKSNPRFQATIFFNLQKHYILIYLVCGVCVYMLRCV